MDFLKKLLKKTASSEDIDRLLAESVHELIKARHSRAEEEEEDEEDLEEKARRAKKAKDMPKEIEVEVELEDEDEEEEKEEEKARKSRSKKAKKEIKEFIGDKEDEGIDETEIDYEEPIDEEDLKEEEKAAEKQKRIAQRSQKAKKKEHAEDDIEEAIEEDQEDAYFEEEDDEDLPGEAFELPEEQGHGKGIITNYGRRIEAKGRKTKKSMYDDPLEDMVEIMGYTTLVLDRIANQQAKLMKATAALMKAMQKINADQELIKAQTPGYPMAPLMYMPPKKVENKKEQYTVEQVRGALYKALEAGRIEPSLLQDFDAWMGRPGASPTEWVNDTLDEPLRKAIGL
ncbi:MAG: hypothetical protein ACPL5F_01395 [Moorellaceae bacterium]